MKEKGGAFCNWEEVGRAREAEKKKRKTLSPTFVVLKLRGKFKAY